MARHDSKQPDADRMREDAPGRYPPDQQFGSQAADDQATVDAAARSGDHRAAEDVIEERRSEAAPRPANKAPERDDERESKQ